MKALVCAAPGPPESLAVQEVALPRPGPGQVLIDVQASALNFPDLLMVQGLYQVKPPLPFSPGIEVAGLIREVGPGVQAWQAGDRVAALPGWGGFAEACLAPADTVMRLPPGVSFDLGAAFGLTYGTSLHALKDCGRLERGETLLVLGAAGGVGSAAVEIGKRLGARVIAAASSDEKLALCRRLGADETIHYSRDDLRQRLRDLTGDRGVDVIYDPVGGPYTEAALRAAGWRGRLLVVGFAAGDIPRLPLNLMLLKERAVIGVYWGDWVRHDPDGSRRNARQLLDWLEAGDIHPAIDSRVPLKDVPAAMIRMSQRQVNGKVVVLPEA